MRKWFSIISTFILVVVILAIAAVWQFKRVLNNLQIESFHYQLEILNLHRIKFSELSFVHKTETAQHTIQLHNVAADWYWQSWFSPQLDVISIQHAQMVQSELAVGKKTPVDSELPIFSLPENWAVPESFPEQIHIHKVTLTLPCAMGLCSFAGSIDALKIKTGKTTTGIELKLNTSPGEELNAQHQLTLNATYAAEKNLPTFAVKLALDESVNLQLNTYLDHQTEIYWVGTLKGSAAYPNEWWITYLKTWGLQLAAPASEQKTITLNSPAPSISLNTEWRLALAPLINLSKTASTSDRIKALSGRWFLDAKIPNPVIIVNRGEFFGNINIDLDVSSGQLNRYALTADVTAQHLIVPNALQLRGVIAETVRFNVESKMNSGVTLNALPVTFSGNTQGALQTNLTGRLLVDTTAKKIIIEQLDLSAKAKQLKPVTGVELVNVNADLHASGYWQPDEFELNISTPNQISADVLAKNLSITSKATQISTSQLNISGDIVQGDIVWPQLKFTTEAQFKGGAFQHPQATAKSWYWRGKAQGSLAEFDINGDLGVGNSLVVKHQAKRKASELMLNWNVPDIFLLATNPFADTLVSWPSLLTLSRGKINASGTLILQLEKNKLTKNNIEVQLADIAGIYDTLAFQGLSGKVKVTANETKLGVSSDNITVNNINKGFDFGPLVAAGKYESSWANLAQGRLDLQRFDGSVMGGSVSTAAQKFDFSRAIQNFTVALKDINLASLLKQYSSSELSGTGLLSGSVPIEINRAGIRVEQGVVAAVEPGGLLQMKSARANAMAKSQPSMKLVVDALNDFHYTALASQINYDEEGKLLLSVKLEGRNPALENGRPIHLNVNLEEDVPAMLASIQLSSKVSDIVKKRLQLRVQQKESAKK